MLFNISGKDLILFASVGIGTAALVIALISLTTSFQFNKNLQPSLSGSFTVGTAQEGIAGIYFGSQPDKFFLDSISNHFFYDNGTQSLTTFMDLNDRSYTTNQYINNQSYTTNQFIQNQSYTSVQYINNQSFSQVQGVFTPSVATLYSTENQYMGLVTESAGLSSASVFYYNYTGLSTNDIFCSVTKPSAGGNSLSGDSKVIVRTSGVYKIGTSIQFDQTANSVTPVGFWLRINDVDVPETGSIQTIIQQNGETVPFMEYITSLSSNSNFEIVWKSYNTTTFAAKFSSAAGIGSASNVNSPSIITNIYRIA
jgi:hypothetical protein